MVEKFKENFLLILLFIFLFVGAIISAYKYKIDDDRWFDTYTQKYEQCQTDSSNNILCSQYKEPVKRRDTVNTFGYIILHYAPFTYLQLIGPLLIMIVTTFDFHKKLKKGYFQNSVIRIGYKNSFRNLYLKSLKKSFILPIAFIFMFICAYLLSGNFDYNYGTSFYHYTVYGIENIKNWFLFLIVFLSNFILHGIFWINIVIYNCKHNKYASVCTIFSYIEFMLLSIILQVVFGGIIFANSSIRYYFSFSYIWVFENLSLIGVLIASLITALLSTIVVLLSYKNKEKVLNNI